jgi:hypothetical protein
MLRANRGAVGIELLLNVFNKPLGSTVVAIKGIDMVIGVSGSYRWPDFDNDSARRRSNSSGKASAFLRQELKGVATTLAGSG